MILLRRYKDSHTEGKMLLPDDSYIYCTERPWLDNLPNVSCIPEGEYIVDRDKHGRFQLYKVRYVEGRTNIEIHAGNDPKIHSQGCILPCMYIENGIGKESRKACNVLLDWYEDKSFILTIKKYNTFKDGKW